MTHLIIFAALLTVVCLSAVLASEPEDNNGIYECQTNDVCLRIHKYMLCGNGIQHPAKCEMPPRCGPEGKCEGESECEKGEYCILGDLYPNGDQSVNESLNENGPCSSDADCNAQYCDLTKELDGKPGTCRTPDLCKDDSECPAGTKCKFSECYNPYTLA